MNNICTLSPGNILNNFGEVWSKSNDQFQMSCLKNLLTDGQKAITKVHFEDIVLRWANNVCETVHLLCMDLKYLFPSIKNKWTIYTKKYWYKYM